MVLVAYENFDPCEHYGVEQYLTSFGLSVQRNYRGRGIGNQLLAARYTNIFYQMKSNEFFQLFKTFCVQNRIEL